MVHENSLSARLFTVVLYSVLLILALLCLLPLLQVFAISLSSRASITAGQVTLLPIGLNFASYERMLSDKQFLRSGWISLQRVVLGTILQVFLSIITAYPLSLSHTFRGQTFFKRLLIFVLMFNGGLIPWYLVLRSLGLVDTLWGLVLPYGVSVWNIILLVNFFRETPVELVDAAEIDGASHWCVLWRIYVPLSIPAIALITLNASVMHWNSWFDGLVLINNTERYPLQSLLHTMIVGGDMLRLLDKDSLVALLSTRGLRATQIVLAMIPILLIYPFLQRYFVTGLKLGSIKG